jgi:hypothetical protein
MKTQLSKPARSKASYTEKYFRPKNQGKRNLTPFLHFPILFAPVFNPISPYHLDFSRIVAFREDQTEDSTHQGGDKANTGDTE